MMERILYPKITVITPVLNQKDYIETAICSVLNQDYPNLEYIVIDGGSTDGTADIIRKYENQIAYWVSEPDTGHGNALNKGFSKSTGDIMGWINGNDMLHPRSLHTIAQIFADYPSINWLTGQPNSIDQYGRILHAYPPIRWSASEFLAGNYRWIHQESTYWRRSLWEKVGAYITEEYKYAVDFELWIRFFRYSENYPAYGLIGGFRYHEEQRSNAQLSEYEEEAAQIVEREIALAETPSRTKPLPLAYNRLLQQYVNPNTTALPANFNRTIFESGRFSDPSEIITELTITNNQRDIVPEESTRALLSQADLPADTLLLGTGWYSLEKHGSDHLRWAENNCQIIVVKPSGEQKQIELDIAPGHSANSLPLMVEIRNVATGEQMSNFEIDRRTSVVFPVRIKKGENCILQFQILNAGNTAAGVDPRVLNLCVYSVKWHARHPLWAAIRSHL